MNNFYLSKQSFHSKFHIISTLQRVYLQKYFTHSMYVNYEPPPCQVSHS